jgi:flagellar biosynthesis/type III secretory pathway protein FliH
MKETALDIEAMIAEVAKRHKILLAPDDPAFALITLNELMLRHSMMTVQDHVSKMEKASSLASEKQIETAKAIAETLITAAAAYMAERFKEATAQAHAAALSQGRKTVLAEFPAYTALRVATIVCAFLCGFLASVIVH